MSDDIFADDDIFDDDEVAEDDSKKKRRGGRGRNKKKEKTEKGGRRSRGKKNADDAVAKVETSDGGQEKSSPLKGLQQWLLDSYNGIFKIVIEPQLPSYRVLGFMIISFLIGMFWAYNLAPTSYYNGAPHQMRSEHQDQYVIGIGAGALAGIYSETDVQELLSRVDSPTQRITRLREITDDGLQTEVALQQIEPLSQGIDGRDSPSGGSFFGTLITVIIAVIIFIAITWVFALAWGLLIGGYYERARLSIKKRLVGESEEDKAARETIEAERKRRAIREQMEADAKDAAAGGGDLGAPVTTKPSIYFKGRSYDDSFAIEDSDDMFLGEMGATIARTVGEAQELAGVEIWLFDKDDFVKTYTKLFVSEHTFNDPAAMSELENRVDNRAEDIAILKPGATLDLISNNLTVRAKVLETTPGTDASLPPNSHFDGLTIQMQAFQTQGSGSPAAPAPVPTPAAAGGLPDMSSYEIGPPPEMPSGMAPPPPPPASPSTSGQRDLSDYEIGPPPPGVKPLSPPPMGATRPSPNPLPELDDDDDPFGGTGDFTPVGG